MSTELDMQSIARLRELRGRIIQQVAGVRYPGVAGYSELRLLDESGRAVSVTLRIADADADLEVSVPVLRPELPFAASVKVDRFELAAFRVALVVKLQRREYIEWAVADDPGYVGSNPREQILAGADDGDRSGTHLVDVGLALESADGLTLEICADSFPLVMQLRLHVAGSVVPEPKRVVVA